MTVQDLTDMIQSRPEALPYSMSGLVGGFSAVSADWVGVILGGIGIAATLAITFYFKRREDRRREREHQAVLELNRAKSQHYGGDKQ